MAKYASFGKRENEKKKQARRVEKQNRKEERKSSGKAASFEDMIAYVDENGMITSVPPELRQKEEINQEDILISTPKKEDVAPVILRGRVDYLDVYKRQISIQNNNRNLSELRCSFHKDLFSYVTG